MGFSCADLSLLAVSGPAPLVATFWAMLYRFAMKRVPRFVLGGLVAASSASVFAQEASTVDLSAAEGLATSLGTALSGFVTGNVIPAVVLIVGAIASLLLLYRLVRWLMRALGGR